jgi:hypothetical protein
MKLAIILILALAADVLFVMVDCRSLNHGHFCKRIPVYGKLEMLIADLTRE